MNMNKGETIDFEQVWEVVEKGIKHVMNILEGKTAPKISTEDHMELYTTIYNMCTQKRPHNYAQQLHDKYRESLADYNTSMVLPSLREKHDEFLLREVVKRWANHKLMVRWLSRFFHYLDRSLPPFNEVSLTCFRELVYQELNAKVKDAVISLIDRERGGEGEQIDRELLKKVLDIFVEIGMGQMEYYENDFQADLLRDTAAYYSRKATIWIEEYSSPEFMLKVEECLQQEKDRASQYLHPSSVPKLLERARHELLSLNANQQVLENDQQL
ncbi:hypothetical protein COLO4_30016 [Corchorus olitorius]|uniref:Cullin N-terminal domain-containing protein n=1 Tax=Corchorus olitorius TaxID=93759 RepID=A0A1R3HBV2_9ROSI|nr:hypothetical protein COLO4_30016 [Corchorus olitorius]